MRGNSVKLLSEGIQRDFWGKTTGNKEVILGKLREVRGIDGQGERKGEKTLLGER